MRRGHVDKVTRSGVFGWALDDQKPALKLRLRVGINGDEVGSCVADMARRDLGKIAPDSEGKHGFSFTFAEPLSLLEASHVSVRFADSGVLLPNGEQVLRHEIIRKRPETLPLPAPILVGAPSRSGTTYLMSCLANSADIVASEVMPYELRLLDYYASAHGVLTAPADYSRSLNPNRVGADPFHIGFNPFTTAKYAASFKDEAPMRELLEQLAPEQLGQTMAEIIREFYRRLARDQGKPGHTGDGADETGKAGVKYFAEKNINLHKQTRRFTRAMFPHIREIAIIRDPRDILCSHKAYYANRGEKSIAELTGSCRFLLQMRDRATDDLHFMRYEDMLQDEPQTFGALSEFLGTPVQAARREEDPAFQRHATSSTPAASIGRWRSELPAEVCSEVNLAWGAFLERFGYELS